jgi:hypothetical protein
MAAFLPGPNTRHLQRRFVLNGVLAESPEQGQARRFNLKLETFVRCRRNSTDFHISSEDGDKVKGNNRSGGLWRLGHELI